MSRAAALAAILSVLSGCGGGGDPSPKPTAASVATKKPVRTKPKREFWPSWIPSDVRKFIDRGGALDETPLYRRGCRNIEILAPQPRYYGGEYVITGRSRAACGRAIRLTLAFDREARIQASRCERRFCADPTALFAVDGFTCLVLVRGDEDWVIRCTREGHQLVRMDLAG